MSRHDQGICHGIPDMRELVEGDIVNIDVSVYYRGFHADLNETFFVGQPDEGSMRLVQCAYESLATAVDMVRPGALYKYVIHSFFFFNSQCSFIHFLYCLFI